MPLVLSVLMLLSQVALPAKRCPNFSGKYLIQGEDGQVHISIKQTGCERIIYKRESNYLEEKSFDRHDLRLDGIPRNDASWIGETDKEMISAQFVGAVLDVSVWKRGSTKARHHTLLYLVKYEMLPNGDLTDVGCYHGEIHCGPGLIAVRQK